MKAITLKKNSWHYWLATNIGDYKEYQKDFCAYVRSVLFSIIAGAFIVALFGSIGLFILYAIGREVYALYTCVISGWIGISTVCSYGKFEDATTGAFAGLAVCAAILAVIVLLYKRKERIRKEIYAGRRKMPEPSFVALAYRSLKEKTCFRVEFQEKGKK